jgi:hypothetical protein
MSTWFNFKKITPPLNGTNGASSLHSKSDSSQLNANLNSYYPQIFKLKSEGDFQSAAELQAQAAATLKKLGRPANVVANSFFEAVNICPNHEWAPQWIHSAVDVLMNRASLCTQENPPQYSEAFGHATEAIRILFHTPNPNPHLPQTSNLNSGYRHKLLTQALELFHQAETWAQADLKALAKLQLSIQNAIQTSDPESKIPDSATNKRIAFIKAEVLKMTLQQAKNQLLRGDICLEIAYLKPGNHDKSLFANNEFMVLIKNSADAHTSSAADYFRVLIGENGHQDVIQNKDKEASSWYQNGTRALFNALENYINLNDRKTASILAKDHLANLRTLQVQFQNSSMVLPQGDGEISIQDSIARGIQKLEAFVKHTPTDSDDNLIKILTK